MRTHCSSAIEARHFGSEVSATYSADAPDPCGTAIVNWTNHISSINPAYESASHKYAHETRARNGNGIHQRNW